MNKYMSNRELMLILDDIQQMSLRPALAFFLGTKIQRFMEQNRTRIQAVDKEMKDLIDKHVMKDAKGTPIIVAFKNTQKYQFLSEEHEKEFEEAMKKLSEKTFDIVF